MTIHKDLYLSGVVRPYRIKSFVKGTQRVKLESLSLKAGEAWCIINPSPMGGNFPVVGSIVYCYDKQGTQKYYLLAGPEIRDDFTPEQALALGQENESGIAPQTDEWDPGDAYCGRLGRFFSDSIGNCTVQSKSKDVSIELSDVDGKLKSEGINFETSSSAGCIRTYTASSTAVTSGDTFYIDKCPPAAISALPLTPAAPISVLTRLSIGADGGFDVKVGGVASPSSLLGMSPLGQLDFANRIFSFDVSPAGDLEMKNAVTSLDMKADAATGDITLKTFTPSAPAVAPATVDTPAADLMTLTMKAETGTIRLAHETLGAQFSADSLGLITVSTGLGSEEQLLMAQGIGTQFTSTTKFDAQAPLITLTGTAININSGTQGAARIADSTLSSIVSDPSFWTFMIALKAALMATPTAADPNSHAAFTLLAQTAAALMPTSLTSKITTGSATVKVGG